MRSDSDDELGYSGIDRRRGAGEDVTLERERDGVRFKRRHRRRRRHRTGDGADAAALAAFVMVRCGLAVVIGRLIHSRMVLRAVAVRCMVVRRLIVRRLIVRTMIMCGVILRTMIQHLHRRRNRLLRRHAVTPSRAAGDERQRDGPDEYNAEQMTHRDEITGTGTRAPVRQAFRRRGVRSKLNAAFRYRFSHSGTRLSASARAAAFVPLWMRPEPSTEKA